MSASSDTRSSSEPGPCPPGLTRRRTGWLDEVAACRRAAIFLAWYALAKGSDSPAVSSTAGYAVPSLTLWYGE